MTSQVQSKLKMLPKFSLNRKLIVGGSLSLGLVAVFVVVMKLVSVSESSALDTGAQAASSTASSSGGSGSVWSSTGNALSTDDSYAESDINKNGANSKYLEITNFGFSLPSSAVISGIEVSVERKAEVVNNISDAEIYLTKNGSSNVGSNYAAAGYWSTSDETVAYGGASDMWGATWSYSDVNASGFGVRIRATNDNSSAKVIAYIDYVAITVYYDVQADGPGGVSANLTIWLMADGNVYEDGSATDEAEENDTVLVWQDQTSNNYDVSSAGSTGSRPHYVFSSMNYNPAIVFSDNGNRHLATGSNPLADDMSWFVVYQSTQSASSGTYSANPAIVGAENSAGSDDYTISQQGGRPFFKGTSVSGFGAQSASTFNNGRPTLLGATRTKSAVGTNYLYVNGAQQASASSDNNSLSDPASLGIGNHDDPVAGSQFKGRIAEVVGFSGVLSSADRNKVETYLGIKYGITVDHDYISSSGTTIWDQSTNSVYHNRLTGIGRDDASGLDQRQSRSVLAGNVVSIGNADIAADNVSNLNAYSVDESFVIFGDDNDVLNGASETDYGTTTNAEAIDRRAARTWLLQETGTVGTLEVTFELNDFPGVRANASTYDFTELRLLIDADGVFASGAYSVSPTSYVYNGSDTSITFHYDFSSGATYFALATLDEVGSPLPVEFSYFEAEAQDEKVALSWGTATETNNDYFEIERSQDGLYWESVVITQGGGTRIVSSDYLEYDFQPLYGKTYYRVKQVDHDGTTDYSDYREVSFVSGKMLSLEIRGVYPNPFVDAVNLEVGSVLSGDAEIAVLNSSGALVHEVTANVSSGSNSIRLEGLGGLPDGQYVVKVMIGGVQATGRLLRS